VVPTIRDRNTGIWFENGKRKWIVELRKLARDRSIDQRPMTFKDLLTWYKAEMVKRGKWE
jgi:predicted site-specific integrase-resolvase